MERIFALCDSDEQYVIRFMEYFKRRQESGFKLIVFTSKESLMEYLQEHSVFVLLLGEGMQDKLQEIPDRRVSHVYRLADRTSCDPESGHMLINRYQMVQAIISDIRADIMKKESKEGSSVTDRLRLISIFSPVQELEALIFAWSAGLLMSERKKVLLVSLELLPVRLVSTADYSEQPITELIYCIKEKLDITSRMKVLSSYLGGLTYLAGISNGADIPALSKEDMQIWLSAIRAQADYDLVIFYICSNTEAAQELIKESDKVIYCGREGLFANSLYIEWKAQMERAGINLSGECFVKLALQQETRIRRLPLTAAELGNTDCWNSARQFLELFY